jgi:hypothetical protein
LRFGQDGGAPFAKLGWEWPTNNLIGGRYPKTMVAICASNHLVRHPSESSADSNSDFLLNFTSWAFHRDHGITIVGHVWDSMRILPLAAVKARRAVT